MPIAVQCSQCGATLGAPESLAGKKARCKCGGVVRVPERAAQVAAVSSNRSVAPAAQADPTCPACGAALARGAVLCTGCGLDLRSGKRLSVKVDVAAEGAPAGKLTKPAKQRAISPAAAAIGGAVFRVVLVLVVLGLAGGAFWYIRDLVRFDPEQQGKQKLAAIGTGTSVQQVVEALGKPQEVHVYLDAAQQKQFNLNAFEAKISYADDFMKAQGKDKLRNGFYFSYRFSAAGLHVIDFDNNGTVQGQHEVPNLFRQ